jgi:hypothetical protein
MKMTIKRFLAKVSKMGGSYLIRIPKRRNDIIELLGEQVIAKVTPIDEIRIDDKA